MKDLRTIVGYNVKALMETRGMSAQQVADEAKITRNAVYHIRAGRSYPRARVLTAIAECLNVKPSKLLEE